MKILSLAASILCAILVSTACTEAVDNENSDQSTEVVARDNTSCVGATCAEEASYEGDMVADLTQTLYCYSDPAAMKCVECRMGGQDGCCEGLWAFGITCEVCWQPVDKNGNGCASFPPPKK